MFCKICKKLINKKECRRCNKVINNCDDCLLSQMKHYYQSFIENVLAYDISEVNVKLEKELRRNIDNFKKDGDICWYCI